MPVKPPMTSHEAEVSPPRCMTCDEAVPDGRHLNRDCACTRPMKDRKFLITDKDGNDVFGGAVGGGNVYVTAYAKALTSKLAGDLKKGESAPFRFNLSGESGDYFLKRVL